jgi:hypothetical protein
MHACDELSHVVQTPEADCHPQHLKIVVAAQAVFSTVTLGPDSLRIITSLEAPPVQERSQSLPSDWSGNVHQPRFGVLSID